MIRVIPCSLLKKLTAIGFDLGEGEQVSWDTLATRGLEFARRVMGINSVLYFTMGEGRACADEIVELQLADNVHRFPQCRLKRIPTKRR